MGLSHGCVHGFVPIVRWVMSALKPFVAILADVARLQIVMCGNVLRQRHEPAPRAAIHESARPLYSRAHFSTHSLHLWASSLQNNARTHAMPLRITCSTDPHANFWRQTLNDGTRVCSVAQGSAVVEVGKFCADGVRHTFGAHTHC